jgi:hypothetical protein
MRAMIKMTASLAMSEVWMLTGPKVSQRLEPLTTLP